MATSQEKTVPKSLIPQDVEKDSTFYATYAKVKELCIKRINTPAYLKFISHARQYREKWRSAYDGTGEVLVKDKGGLKWIKANIEKTTFDSYEEAVKEFEEVIKAITAETLSNQKFNDVYFPALLKYGSYIYLDLKQEMMEEYPEYF